MFARIILVLLCCPNVLLAQLDPDVSQALRYKLPEIIVSDAFRLDLESEQQEAIEEIRRIHMETYHAALQESWGPDGPPAVFAGTPEEFEEMQRKRAPWKAGFERQRQLFEDQLRSTLFPHQLEAAEDMLLKERYKIGGLRAVVRSTDVAAINNLNLRQTLDEVGEQLERAIEKDERDIEALEQERRQIVADFRRKALEIQNRELNVILDELGNDGEKLRDFVTKLSGDFPGNPFGTVTMVLQHGFSAAVLGSVNPPNYLDLTDDQKEEIKRLHESFLKRCQEILEAEISQSDDLFGIPSELDARAVEELKREEIALSQKLRTRLISDQIE